MIQPGAGQYLHRTNPALREQMTETTQRARRELRFETLEEVAQEAKRLLQDGYVSTGNWSLAQVCGHLNDWMGFSMDGYAPAPLPIRVVLWLMKVTVGRRQLESVFEAGFRDRLPTVPATVHAADEQGDLDAVDQLIETIHRFHAFDGPIAPSPLYGALSKEEAVRLQLVHCAHHLRFLEPGPSSEPKTS
ncbi:MAG: DUF1569 domain-containing protein [Rubripirellula sp.]